MDIIIFVALFNTVDLYSHSNSLNVKMMDLNAGHKIYLAVVYVNLFFVPSQRQN